MKRKQAFGSFFVRGLGKLGEVVVLLIVTLRALRGLRHHRERLWSELEGIGVGSVIFIMATSMFMGIIVVSQTATQINRTIPDLTLLGAGFIRIMTNEMVPLIAGLMMSARVGSGIASEVASMVVTEQMDALRLANTDPVEYIIAPKLVASLIAVPIVGLMGLTAAIIAGAAVSWSVYDVHPSTFLNFRYTYGHHFLACVVKLLTFGAIIPIAAVIEGFRTGRKGAFSVGQSATRGVIMSSFFIFMADLTLSLLQMGIWGS